MGKFVTFDFSASKTNKENIEGHVTLRQHFTETTSALSRRRGGREGGREGSVRNFLNGFGNSDDRLEMGAARKSERPRCSDKIVDRYCNLSLHDTP